jgi:lysophospholipase L1-like esterase
VRTIVATALLLAVTACGGGGEPGAPRSPEAAGPTATQSASTPAPTRAAGMPRSMVAMGDSITQAFLGCGFGDCPAASWASGTDPEVNSHATRLGIADAQNVAVSGAKVDALPGQAETAAAAKPDYVTILVGANDACRGSEDDMTPVAEYAATFERALDTLDDTGAKVLVVSIPDLLRVWELAHDRPEARERWARFGICGSMLGDPDANGAAQRRTRVRDRVVAYNAAMRAACAKHDNCRDDGGAMFRYAFTLEELGTLDYWHPSRLGQRALAEVTWKAGYWG